MGKPGEDALLGDLEPEALFEHLDANGINLGFALKYAYTGAWSYLWGNFHEAWQNTSDAKVWEALPPILQDAVARREPITLDTQFGGAGDLMLLRGRDLWHMQPLGPEQCGPTMWCRTHMHANVPEPDPVHMESKSGKATKNVSAAGSGVERRRAFDGQLYTKFQFWTFYGGLSEWHEAKKEIG